MKYITLLGFLAVLSITTVSAKETPSNSFLKMSIVMSDTTDTSVTIIPNVFSPNGDGQNDLFKAVGNFTKLNVKIYNRYGELIYKSIQLNEGWNGRTNTGALCTAGTYFYIIETNTETFTGSLTLFR